MTRPTVFWVAIAVIGIDLSRTVVSLRAARRYSSAALLSNALHFGSDLVGTVAVLLGLVVAALGWPQGDSVAALFVSFLVVTAAVRLMDRNIDVLMDRAPADAVETARRLRSICGMAFAMPSLTAGPGTRQDDAGLGRLRDAGKVIPPTRRRARLLRLPQGGYNVTTGIAHVAPL